MTTTSETADRPALRRPDGTPIRALVVDDEPALTDLLSMALRYEGWEVRTAADGAHAVTAARQFRPDVILLDVMLPDLDGLSVLRRIRADNHDVPVVFLTAKDAVDDRVAGLTVGADDYVTKPFSLEEVIARLRALLRRSTSNPSKSGSITSRTTASGRNSRAVRTADVPSDAVRTSQPSYRMAIDSSSVRLLSSSTARIRMGVPSGRVRGAGEVCERLMLSIVGVAPP